MPSKKSTEQALTWLRSKAADKDSLDGINAELCLNVIQDLKDRNNKQGYTIHKLLSEKGNDISFERFKKLYGDD